VQLTVHGTNDSSRVFADEQSGVAKRRLDVRYDERCREAITGRIGDGEPNAPGRDTKWKQSPASARICRQRAL